MVPENAQQSANLKQINPVSHVIFRKSPIFQCSFCKSSRTGTVSRAAVYLKFHFHSFFPFRLRSYHLALVPYLARVYSARESRLDADFFGVRGSVIGGEFTMGASANPQDNAGELGVSDYDLDPSYIPGDNEPFMNEKQLRYFEKQLIDWKNSILAESQGTLNQLQDGPMREPDLNDRASSETDWGIELRTRDRQRKLIAKIDAALRRITEGEYGYCQVTGEPISLARLRARPIATMTLEAQERHERQERVSRDD